MLHKISLIFYLIWVHSKISSKQLIKAKIIGKLDHGSKIHSSAEQYVFRQCFLLNNPFTEY